MTAQLDIFAAAAEEDSIPDTTWPPHYGPVNRWSWNPCLGPHPTWEAFVECWTEEDSIDVYEDKRGYKASVRISKDASTGLWIGYYRVNYRYGGISGAPTYSPAAYHTRESCIAAWTERAMQLVREYQRDPTTTDISIEDDEE